MTISWTRVGAISGALTVLFGAFGAHMLEKHFDERSLEIWHTGVQYQGLHALALLALGLGTRAVRRDGAGWSFLVGTFFFSGSLYGLALGGPSWLGPVTPIGGLAFVLGWILIAVQGVGPRDDPRLD